MEQQVQNQITGSINPEAVKALIGGKVKRNSSKKAAKIVKNSVPASKKKTKITKEQGFGNYLKYTDPLLLNNNEVDKSDIANSLVNLLNVFSPKKMGTEKMKEVQGYITKEEPVDVAEAAPVRLARKPQQFAPSGDNIRENAAIKIQGLAKGVNFRKTKLPALIEADVLDKRIKAENKAATIIQKIVRGSQIRQPYNVIKEQLDRQPVSKSIASLEKGTLEEPLIVLPSPVKLKKMNKQRKKEDAAKTLAPYIRAKVSRQNLATKEGFVDKRHGNSGRPKGSKRDAVLAVSTKGAIKKRTSKKKLSH